MSTDTQGAVSSETRATRRRLVVAWRDSSIPAISIIGHLDYDGHVYRFSYVEDAARIPGFRPLVEFPEWGQLYESDELFPFFAQRIMDRRRADYLDYLDALALPRDADAFDVLGRSGGRRKADKVQVAELPLVAADGTMSFDFLVHGSRFSPAGEEAVSVALRAARAGDDLALVPEPDNPVNPEALLVATVDGVPIGWVPDLLVPSVSSVRESAGWTLSVRRVNGPEMGWQLRVVAHLSGRLPSDDQRSVWARAL